MRCTHYKSSTPALRWKKKKKQNKTKQNKPKKQEQQQQQENQKRQKHKRKEKESLTIFDGFTLELSRIISIYLHWNLFWVWRLVWRGKM